MNTSQILIAVSILALAVVAFLVFFVSKNRKENRTHAIGRPCSYMYGIRSRF